MARSEARIFTRIWQDNDFVALPAGAQRMYLLALSQPGLSLCGVVDYTAKRWASLAPDTNVRDVTRALDRLAATNFIVVDDESEELWIRSFLKHDVGAFKNHNLVVAITRDYAAIASHPIRDGVAKGVRDGVAKGFPDGVPEALWNRVPEEVRHLLHHGVQHPLPDPVGDGIDQGVLAGVRARSPVPTPVPAPPPGPVPDPVPPPDPRATSTEGANQPAEEELYTTVLDLAADRDLTRAADAGETIRDPDAYRRRCRARRASQHGADLRQLITAHPTWPPERLLDTLDDQSTSRAPDATETRTWLDQQRADEAEIDRRAAQADAAIAALDDPARQQLRARAEAEVQPVAGRRPEVFVTAAMRRLVLDPASPNGAGT